MGTSTSFRAPPVPRWQAFTTALQRELPVERVRSELFNAGRDWEAAIASPAVATFAAALVDALDVLPDRLSGADRPERVLQTYVSATRAASAEVEPTAALPLAERALAAVLIRSAAGTAPLSTQTAEDAAQHLRASLSERQTVVASYLGEVLSQYALHVTAREIGRLTEGPKGVSVAVARQTTRRLAVAAEEVGRTPRPALADSSAVREAWSTLVHEAFGRGRELPQQPG
jgi:hypothetical protein